MERQCGRWARIVVGISRAGGIELEKVLQVNLLRAVNELKETDESAADKQFQCAFCVGRPTVTNPPARDPNLKPLPLFISEWDNDPSAIVTKRISLNGRVTYEQNENFERLFFDGNSAKATYSNGNCAWRYLFLGVPKAMQVTKRERRAMRE